MVKAPERVRRPPRLVVGAEGWYYTVVMVLVLAGALLREINLLMLLAGLMAGPLLFNLLLAIFALRKIDVIRQLPIQVFAGDQAAITLLIANRRRWTSLWALRLDDLVTRDAGFPLKPVESRRATLLLERIRAGEEVQVTYTAHFAARGRYRFGPLVYGTAFPLGLIRRQRMDRRISELIVYPRLGRLSPRWRQWQEQRAVTGVKSDFRRGIVEGDFHGLRDWRSGDNRRWIHGRSSARRGSLVVRQFEQHRSDDIHVLVDLWQSPRPTRSQRDVVETAVSLAATVITDVCRRRGKRLRVSIGGAEYWHRSGQPSIKLLTDINEALALAAAHSESRLPDPLLRAMRRGTSAQTVMISTRAAKAALHAATDDHHDGSRLANLKWIDVTSTELGEYFELGDLDAGATLVSAS
jgi:uncharacterized protein (DUF58 family)